MVAEAAPTRPRQRTWNMHWPSFDRQQPAGRTKVLKHTTAARSRTPGARPHSAIAVNDPHTEWRSMLDHDFKGRRTGTMAWSTDDVKLLHGKRLCVPRTPPLPLNQMRQDPLLQEIQQRPWQPEARSLRWLPESRHMHAGDDDHDNSDVSPVGLAPDARAQVQAAIHRGVLRESSRLKLEVEFCRAQRPSFTLRGSSMRYLEQFNDIVASVSSVAQEPSSQEEGPFLHGAFSAMRWCTVCEAPPKLDAGKPASRIGAFEVQLVWENGVGDRQQLEVFTKLKSGLWPHAGLLVNDLVELLPRLANASSLGKMSQEHKQALQHTQSMAQKQENTIRQLQTKLQRVERALALKQEDAVTYAAAMAASDVADVASKLRTAEERIQVLQKSRLERVGSASNLKKQDVDEYYSDDFETEEDLSMVKEKLRNCEDELQSCLCELATSKDELRRVQDEAQTLRMHTSSLEDMVHGLRNDLETMKHSLASAKSRVVEVEAMHRDTQSNASLEQQKSNERIAELSLALANERDESTALLKKERHEATEMLQKIRQEYDEIASRVQKEAVMAVANGNREAQTIAEKARQEAAAEVASDRQALARERAVFKKIVAAEKQKADGLQTQLNGMESKLSHVTAQLEVANDKVSVAAGALSSVNDRLKDAEDDERKFRQEREQELQHLQEGNALLKVANAELREQLLHVQQALATVTAERTGSAEMATEQDSRSQIKGDTVQDQETAAQRLQLWQERVRELEAQRTEMLRLHAEQLSALNLEREERLMESGRQLAQAEAKIARAEEGRLGSETEAQRLRQHVVQLQMEREAHMANIAEKRFRKHDALISMHVAQDRSREEEWTRCSQKNGQESLTPILDASAAGATPAIPASARALVTTASGGSGSKADRLQSYENLLQSAVLSCSQLEADAETRLHVSSTTAVSIPGQRLEGVARGALLPEVWTFCSKCGHRVDGGADSRFCSFCGRQMRMI